MNPHTETLPAPSPVRRFRQLPPAIAQVLAAARRIDPARGLFVTYAPGTKGADWEFHPFKRWLILRTLDPEIVAEAVACALLARTTDLGKGDLTDVPRHLLPLHRRALCVLNSAIGTRPASENVALSE